MSSTAPNIRITVSLMAPHAVTLSLHADGLDVGVHTDVTLVP